MAILLQKLNLSKLITRTTLMGLAFVAFGCAGEPPTTTTPPTEEASQAPSVVEEDPIIPVAGAGQFVDYSIDVGGISRRYRVYLPTTYDPSRPQPYAVLLAFHGRGTIDFIDMEPMTQLSDKAETNNFVLVYPLGLASVDPCKQVGFLGWNAGEQECDGSAACKAQYGECRDDFLADDLGFTRTLIDHLLNTFHLDSTKVFTTGFSSGAVFSYALACTATDVIKAIAPVSGYLPALPNPIIGSSCDPPAPINLLDIAGSIDPAYNVNPLSAEIISNLGSSNSSCQIKPTPTRLPPLDEDDERTVDHFVYPTCTAGSQVEQYLVNGGWHAWPGGNMVYPLLPRPCDPICQLTVLPLVEDLSTKNLIANDAMWDFFMQVADD
jgi:polyhydroxybutyrate depolymerase